MKKVDLKKFRTILEAKMDAILHSSGKKTYWENMESTRRGDFVDQASDDNEVHVNSRLRQTDAKLLRAVAVKNPGEDCTTQTRSAQRTRRKRFMSGLKFRTRLLHRFPTG